MDNALQLDTEYRGYVEFISWNYYHIPTYTQNTLIVTLDQDSQDSDCDIFAKTGAKPTLIDYDYYDASTEKRVNLTIPHPGRNTWYIGVFGSSISCDYSMKISFENGCGECVHGTCVDSDVCMCEAGWTGENCDKGICN